MSLPRFVVLKSNNNNKYLRYIYEDVKVHKFIQFSGEEVVNPYAKFEVEQAKSGNGLVHLRCCYNNKYWQRQSPDHWWILAAADKPEEDQSKWSCTLFKPIFVNDDAKTVLFLHVQLGHYACLCRADVPFDSCLFAGSKDPDKDLCDVYTVIDWESLVILPKHVAFKGDNGKYLSASWIEGHQYLQFASTDIGDPAVGNEIITTHDGSIRIKSNYFGKFWRRSPNWIWADTDDTSNDNPDTLFWPVKVDNNGIALRNLGNNNFCKRLTTEGKTGCLNAAISSISREAKMEVEELVTSRKIYNIKYRLEDVRIYDEQVVTMDTAEAFNETDKQNEMGVNLRYKESKSRTWSNSFSLKFGVTVKFEAGVPEIESQGIEVSTEFDASYQWGETNETEQEVEHVYSVSVPPKTTVTVKVIASRGSCDVPFSYTQRDTLTNGQVVIHNRDDGIFTGINCYNVRYETKEEPLSDGKK